MCFGANHSKTYTRPIAPESKNTHTIATGVRTLKVLLPPSSERDRVTLVGDKNAWAGIPVGIAKRKPPPERLGPPPRPGTITDRDGRNPPPSVVGGGDEFLTRYNWIPAPLVGKTPLVQTRSAAVQNSR